jgi:hypothetical protein
MKNITPIENGKTIEGIFPDMTSDTEETAKDTVYSKISVIGLFAYFNIMSDRSMLIFTYFSAKTKYVEIRTSRANQKYNGKKPFINRLVSEYTMDKNPEM